MTHHDLIDWVKDHPGRTAAMGGALVAALVLLMLMLGRGGEVPPTVVQAPAAATGNTPGANGTAQPQQPGQPSAAPDGSATGNSGPSAPDGTILPATAEQAANAGAIEAEMNRGVVPVHPAGGTPTGGSDPVSTPLVSPPAVVKTGALLESARAKVQACMDGGHGDAFECLGLVRGTVDVEHVYDTAPQGAKISAKTPDGTKLVLSWRGDEACHAIGDDGTDCNAWSSGSTTA